MEEAFLKAWGNRKKWCPALPDSTNFRSNSEMFQLLDQDRFFCYMIVKFWGRCMIKKVLLVRDRYNIYRVDDFKYFCSIFPEGIYKHFIYPEKFMLGEYSLILMKNTYTKPITKQ